MTCDDSSTLQTLYFGRQHAYNVHKVNVHQAMQVKVNGDSELNDHGEPCDRLVPSDELEDVCEMESSTPKNKISREFTVQVFLAIVLFFAASSSGMAMGYPAILLPQLKDINGSLNTNEEMGSWIASIFPAFTPLGSLLSGVVMFYFGPMATLKVQTLVVAVSWVFVVFCENHAVLLLGRLIGGTASGLGVVAGQVYIAEVANPKMRGVLSSIPFLSYAFGILLVYALGSALHWRVVAGLSTILPIASIFMYIFFPESPVWLIRKGHIDKAQKSSLWIRGNITKMEREIQQLINRVENERLQQEENSQSTWATLTTPQVLKPFLIVNLFNFFQALSGLYLIVFYAVEIISELGGQTVDKMFAAVLSAGIRLIFTIVGCFLLAFVGRRTIGLFSGLSTAITALILGTYMYFNEGGYFAATCLLLYVAANTTGLLILPAVMMGELFPAKARSLAGSISYTIFSLFTFGIAKMYPFLKQRLKMYGLFWLFGVSSLLLSVLVFFMLPETKNRTLNDIEDYFLQDNLLWIGRNRSRRNKSDSANNSKENVNGNV